MQSPDYTFDPTRLAVLDAFDILDTPAEEGFDDIVNLASQICDTPVSLVSFVAKDRQWFKARVGFEDCQTDLSRSVCSFALVEPDILIIEDLTADPRTTSNPLVTGEPHIRFYAGAPLRAADGAVLGSLCVIDGVARPQGLTLRQADGLRNLARQVVRQLELRRALAQRDNFLAESRRAEQRRGALLLIGDRLRSLDTISEMTRAVAEIVCHTLGLIRAGFGRLDATNEFIDIEADWTADGFASTAGRQRLTDYGDLDFMVERNGPVIITDVVTDPFTAAAPEKLQSLGIRALVNTFVRDHGAIALFFAHSDHVRDWAPEDLTFLKNVGDRLAASVARADAVARQRVLNMELSHRMKNTMALVLAIAKQTLRSVPDQAPVEAFRQRLQALSTAHEALLQESWTSARLDEIATNVLSLLENIDRFTIKGPMVVMGPRAALSVSLLLHELSTNALKHGAFVQPGGRVDVSWQVTGEDLVLSWREVGGPVVTPPTANGFGSRLIKMGLIGTGGVDLRYPPTGFEADFKAPLSQVQEIPGSAS